MPKTADNECDALLRLRYARDHLCEVEPLVRDMAIDEIEQLRAKLKAVSDDEVFYSHAEMVALCDEAREQGPAPGERLGVIHSKDSHAVGWQDQILGLARGQRVFVEARIGGVYGFIRTLVGRYTVGSASVSIAGQGVELVLVVRVEDELTTALKAWAATTNRHERDNIAAEYFARRHNR